MTLREHVCFLDENMERGGAEVTAGLPGPPDGAGNQGDPPALPGQAPAHPGRHRGQEATPAEPLRHFDMPILKRLKWTLGHSHWTMTRTDYFCSLLWTPSLLFLSFSL